MPLINLLACLVHPDCILVHFGADMCTYPSQWNVPDIYGVNGTVIVSTKYVESVATVEESFMDESFGVSYF